MCIYTQAKQTHAHAYTYVDANKTSRTTWKQANTNTHTMFMHNIHILRTQNCNSILNRWLVRLVNNSKTLLCGFHFINILFARCNKNIEIHIYIHSLEGPFIRCSHGVNMRCRSNDQWTNRRSPPCPFIVFCATLRPFEEDVALNLKII